MDIPRNTSVGNYQIHRTPYFRRLHRQDSYEIERLREAYDSVCKFDQKPIETQVKKIRLGKLFQRIKNTFSGPKAKRVNKKPKTRDEIRRQELARARQMGTEYLRQNMLSNIPSLKLYDKRSSTKELKSESSSLARRLEYGNSRSQYNRNKLLHSQNSQQASADNDTKTAIMRKHLLYLKKTWPRERFIKFLVSRLSAGTLNHDFGSTFQEILLTKNDLYWDLIQAINEQQRNIKTSSKFIDDLSALALNDEPECRAHITRKVEDGFIETFDSQTNVHPNRFVTPEVYIRTFRYSDDNEYLPPPSESLLKLPDDIIESTITDQDQFDMYSQAHTSLQHTEDSSSMLSGHLLNVFQSDSADKALLSKKLSNIIREMVRKESVAMLANFGNMNKY